MVEFKEYECVQVGHHRDIGKTVEEWQTKGWRLHTYTCSHAAVGQVVNHYLLFEIESDKKMSPSAEAAAAAAAAAAAGA